MRRLAVVISSIALIGCSSKEQPGTSGGDAGTVIVEQTVSADTGALILHDGDPSIVLSVPPSAVGSDVSVTISLADDDVDDAASPVVTISPEATTLAFPGSLSIGVESVEAGHVLARVTETGLERLPRSSVDPSTNEVRAEIDRLGRFVVVASDAAKPPPADVIAETAALATTLDPTREPTGAAPSAGMFTTPVDESAPPPAAASPIEGAWNGAGPHAAFRIAFQPTSFEVTRDGAVVRSGTYTLNGTTLTLTDTTGATEVASAVFAGNELTLDSAESGTVRWQRAGNDAQTPKGFFVVDEMQAAPKTQRGAPVAKATAAPPKKPASAPAPLPSAPPSVASTEPAKKKNVFERLGSGVANVGRNVVQGVKSIGKSGAAETQALVEQEVASATMCSLLAPVAAMALGDDQQPPKQRDNGCEIRDKQGGKIGFSVNPTGDAGALDRYRRNGECTVAAVGDDACLVNLGGSRAKLVFRKGTTTGTVDVDTPGGDAVLVTTQIAQIVAAQL